MPNFFFFALSVEFNSKHNGDSFLLTNVYALCSYPEKLFFLIGLKIYRCLTLLIRLLWETLIYAGPLKIGTSLGDLNDMFLFNDAMSALGLVELPLKGRRFTWTNKQRSSPLERLHFFFLDPNLS
jgi:hypothetical protein